MRDRFTPAPGASAPVSELQWRFTTSGGPGGQHANRSATRVAVTFDISGSPSIDDDQRSRLERRFGHEVSVVVDETRSQTRNREIAVERLEARLASAFATRRARRPSRPSRAAQARRLEDKRQRSQRKAQRRRPGADD